MTCCEHATHNGNTISQRLIHFILTLGRSRVVWEKFAIQTKSFIFRTKVISCGEISETVRSLHGQSLLLHFRLRKKSRGPKRSDRLVAFNYRYQLHTFTHTRGIKSLNQSGRESITLFCWPIIWFGPTKPLFHWRGGSTGVRELLRCRECINFPHDTLPATP
jgi:hypothetical protein